MLLDAFCVAWVVFDVFVTLCETHGDGAVAVGACRPWGLTALGTLHGVGELSKPTSKPSAGVCLGWGFGAVFRWSFRGNDIAVKKTKDVGTSER